MDAALICDDASTARLIAAAIFSPSSPPGYGQSSAYADSLRRVLAKRRDVREPMATEKYAMTLLGYFRTRRSPSKGRRRPRA